MHHRDDYNPQHRQRRHEREHQQRNWHPSQGEQEGYRDFSDRWQEPRPFFEQDREHYRNYPQQGWHPSEERAPRYGSGRPDERPPYRYRRGEDFGPHNQQAFDRWNQPVYRPYFREQRHEDFYEEDRDRFRG